MKFKKRVCLIVRSCHNERQKSVLITYYALQASSLTTKQATGMHSRIFSCIFWIKKIIFIILLDKRACLPISLLTDLFTVLITPHYFLPSRFLAVYFLFLWKINCMPHAFFASLWLTSGEHVAGSNPTYLGIGMTAQGKARTSISRYDLGAMF